MLYSACIILYVYFALSKWRLSEKMEYTWVVLNKLKLNQISCWQCLFFPLGLSQCMKHRI